MDGNEIKLVIFADNMTSFVRDKLSHRMGLFDILTLFSTYSGLKVNHGKSPHASRLGHKSSGKNSVRNLRYGPRPRLERGVYSVLHPAVWHCSSCSTALAIP